AGNNFLSAIPCVGFYLAPFAYLWWAISGGFMLARAQRVSGWRAGVAMALPGLIIVLGLGGLIGWAIYEDSRSATRAGLARGTQAPASSSFSAPGEAASYIAVTLSELDADGPFDAHATRLLLDGDLDPEDLLLPGSASTSDDTISGVPLRMFTIGATNLEPTVQSYGSPGQHRVGDFVFVCKGIDPKTADERLWLAIGWPNPLLNGGTPKEVELVKAKGTYELITFSDFQKRLDEQNELRKELGLDPIRHPALGP
ncbi:MAG: hypothetical protein K2Q20_00570, partial [Phycisphaerales bacterium]|nr:hypothetical protein [Phycisphaerales bacterium]